MDTLEFTTELARETGKLLLSYYRPSGIDSQLKSDRTVVTEADLAADLYLREKISKTFPEDAILSEEAGTIFPVDKSAVWIIDPLDGTTNFSLGFHYWGVAIARLINGIPDIGVLFFPLLNELISATKGAGSYLNNIRLRVQAPKQSQPTSFFSCCSRANNLFDISIKYKTRILGSAAYGLATVARGSAILAFEVTPKVWDFSASWLITQEAGGVIVTLNGEDPYPLIAGVDYQNRSFPILAAATPELLAEGKSKIKKK